MRITAFLILLITALEASAAEWYRLSMSSNEGQITYIDASSLSVTPQGTRRAWLTAIKRNQSSIKYLESVKCKARESATISSVAYTKDGVSLGSHHYKNPEYTPVIPETLGETSLEAICSQSIKEFAIRRGGYYTPSPSDSAELEFNPDAPPAAEDDNEAPEADTAPPADLSSSAFSDMLGIPANCNEKCAEGYNWAIQHKPVVTNICYLLTDTREIFGCQLWMKKNRP